MLTGRKAQDCFQSVNIRGIPTRLVRKWRRAIDAKGLSMQEWFILHAAKTADDGKDKPA
jgi:hypothetical protein